MDFIHRIRACALNSIRIIALITLTTFLSYPQVTSAAALTNLSDTMSRQAAGEESNHTIKFTTATGVAAGQNIQITFPSGFTIGSVDYTDIDISWGPSTGAENELTLGASASGSTWGASFGGQVLTITSGTGTISAASKIIIEIGTNASGGNAQITNNSSAATYTLSIAGTFGDTGKIAIVIVDDDQVVLTATVNPSITFTVSAATSSFGDLSTGSITTAGTNITLTIGTNAQNGYVIQVNDSGDGVNPGLYNSDASYVIGSVDSSYNNTGTLSAGTEGYGIQGSSAGATIDARFNQTGNDVGGLETTPVNFASHSSTMNSSHTITVTHKAAISSWTSAGTYTDTVTYIATGNY